MATERQIAANRLNAERSPGPKTPDGKAVASRNAVTHGLTSYSGLLPGEKLEDFSDLRARVFAELAPDSAIEGEVAERIASLLWRLRRVPAFEAALLAWTHACNGGGQPFYRGRAASHPALLRPATGTFSASIKDILAFGRSLDGFLKGGVGGKLSRYEAAPHRQLSALMLELRRMQSWRKAQGSPDVCMGTAIGEGGGVTPRLAFTSKGCRKWRSRSRASKTPPGLNETSQVRQRNPLRSVAVKGLRMRCDFGHNRTKLGSGQKPLQCRCAIHVLRYLRWFSTQADLLVHRAL